jgi:hypothetical protein
MMVRILVEIICTFTLVKFSRNVCRRKLASSGSTLLAPAICVKEITRNERLVEVVGNELTPTYCLL